MIILDTVIEACSADGVLVELGLIENHWALVMYDDIGDDIKTYPDESAARDEFVAFQEGRLQFNALFGFIKQDSLASTKTAANAACAMAM